MESSVGERLAAHLAETFKGSAKQGGPSPFWSPFLPCCNLPLLQIYMNGFEEMLNSEFKGIRKNTENLYISDALA